MTVIRFHVTSSLSPSEVVNVLTDFSDKRVEAWPSVDAEHLTVHATGATWAEVTEGTQAAWERARYEWDAAAGRVTVTTHESKVFGEGGGWVFQATPTDAGTRVDIELTRVPQSFSGKLIASLLPLVGPASLRKSFQQALKAK